MEKERNSALSDKEISSIIIGKLLNISGILQREGNRLLLPFQLNQQQFAILFEIAKAKEVQQKNMVNRLLLEKAHVSKVVKKLQAMGLIINFPLPDDKRSSILSPTEKGLKLIGECQKVFGDWNRQWFSEYSAEELFQILDSVDKLQRTFKSKK